MTIIIDTREKPKAITKIVREFERQHVNIVRSKLYVGDYQFLTNPMRVVDRKQNLSELVSNVGVDHKRFAAELERAQAEGIEVIILVEHGHGIRNIEDVRRWVNPRLKQSPLAISGERLYKILIQMEKHYGIKFEFCNKDQTGARILEILTGGENGQENSNCERDPNRTTKRKTRSGETPAVYDFIKMLDNPKARAEVVRRDRKNGKHNA